jgi:hypothetical protein
MLVEPAIGKDFIYKNTNRLFTILNLAALLIKIKAAGNYNKHFCDVRPNDRKLFQTTTTTQKINPMYFFHTQSS